MDQSGRAGHRQFSVRQSLPFAELSSDVAGAAWTSFLTRSPSCSFGREVQHVVSQAVRVAQAGSSSLELGGLVGKQGLTRNETVFFF